MRPMCPGLQESAILFVLLYHNTSCNTSCYKRQLHCSEKPVQQKRRSGCSKRWEACSLLRRTLGNPITQHRRHHQQQQRNIFHNTNNRNLKHEPRVTALHPLHHSSFGNYSINADDITTNPPPTQKQPEHLTDADNKNNSSPTL